MDESIKLALARARGLLPGYWPWQAKYRRVPSRPWAVFLIALPRTGSTLAKRYLGEHPELIITPNQRRSETWARARRLRGARIPVDKRVSNFEKLERMYLSFGVRARYLLLVRDPRDQFVSLWETTRHPEVPRDGTFWPYWTRHYRRNLDLAERLADRGPPGTVIGLMRYEDLVSEPRSVKQAFLDWLGVEAHEGEVSADYSTADPAIASGRNDKEDWKTHRHGAVHEASTGRWRQVQDPRLSEVLAACRSHPEAETLMRQLGYDEHGPGPVGELPGVRNLGARR